MHILWLLTNADHSKINSYKENLTSNNYPGESYELYIFHDLFSLLVVLKF
jgi:hypothetical protein